MGNANKESNLTANSEPPPISVKPRPLPSPGDISLFSGYAAKNSFVCPPARGYP